MAEAEVALRPLGVLGGVVSCVGGARTVRVTDALAIAPVSTRVACAEITAVPAETALSWPVLLTAAMAGLELLQLSVNRPV